MLYTTAFFLLSLFGISSGGSLTAVTTAAESLPEPTETLWEWFLRFLHETFTPQFYEYKHLDVSDSSIVTVKNIVIGLCFGVIVASLSAIFNKKILGGFVRKINKENANNRESALTLSELGYCKSFFVRLSLKRGVTLKKVVRCVGEEEYYEENGVDFRPKRLLVYEREKEEEEHSSEENKTPDDSKTPDESKAPDTEPKSKKGKFDIPRYKINTKTDRFFIDSEDKYFADIKFEEKGTSWRSFILTLVITVATAVLIIRFMPDIFQFIDNFLSIFSIDNNIVG